MSSHQPDLFLSNLLLFPRILRRAGLPVSPEQSMELAQALTWVDVGDREQVYHTARAMLVRRQEHLALFTVLFNRFWLAAKGEVWSRPQTMPRAPRHKTSADLPPLMTLMAQKAGQQDKPQDVADRSGTYSPSELIQNKAFSEMTEEELANVKKLIQEMRWQVAQRLTRRRVPDRHGQHLHLRQVLRTATQYNGVPLRLAWQSRKQKPRPLILIADISGSMEKYARLLLQFFYSVSHSFKEVECFLFGTRLTRITQELRLKNIDLALEEASHHVVDWAGGTRIGASLAAFNRRWGRRMLRRGAIVLIVSDGWERGDTAQLRREMRYLQHRCHRLIWLNPLLGQKTYKPLVEGIAAALPYIDDFLPIHNLQSLNDLSRHLAGVN
ncbi:MAG: VWA domain-containing protein [Candidatus Promineifilaceae bacterium]